MIVLPIFLIRLYDSLSFVFLWVLAWNLIYMIIFIPIFNWGMKSGKPKYFMATGMLFYVIALWLFSLVDSESIGLLVVATLIFTLYISFYWMTRHWFFSVNADHKQIGKQVSTLAIIRIAISFVAPILAGLVSFFAGFNVAFRLGAVIAFLGLIPILLFHAPPHSEHFSLKKVMETLKKPELKAIRPAYFWEGMESNFIGLSWLLAFALFIGDVRDLGFLVGVSALVAGILSKLCGNLFDQKKRINLLESTTKLRMVGALLYSSVFFFPQLIYVYLVNTLNYFIETAQRTTTGAYLYAFGSKVHPVNFNLNREIYLTLGRIISSSTLAIAFYFLQDEFLWLAIFIGTFMLIGWLSLKKSDHLLH